jgi:glucose-6-phosphate-specific signal transduction histidine kinase
VNNAAQFNIDRISALRLAIMSSPMSKHSDQVVNDIAGRYFLVLGAAAADLWGELPQELQQQLFERAVLLGHQGEQDESLREQLAKFLHDHHERTAQALPGR